MTHFGLETSVEGQLLKPVIADGKRCWFRSAASTWGVDWSGKQIIKLLQVELSRQGNQKIAVENYNVLSGAGWAELRRRL